MTEKRSRWGWKRWIFILAFVAAVTVITIRVIAFLEEAQMSLGLDRRAGAGMDGLLINHQGFDPPADSLLRPSQMHVALRLAEAVDSLTAAGTKKSTMQNALAEIMNEHMASRASYIWVRTQITRALSQRPVNHRDSVHVDMLRMTRPRFEKVRRVYRDTLDRLLLP